MSEAVDRGITVTEIASMDQPIKVCPETTAAFVGRALRGPFNTPVLVENFGEFRRRFGDVWGRSSLGPAAKQFFEHDGKRLYIVRVANNARGAMLCLPARGSALIMRAIEPGSTEYVRAAIDYDGIGDDVDEFFNLTLQRVNPVTGFVIDQEFFRELSWMEAADSFVADALLTSAIARVERPHPTHRPERTLAAGSIYQSIFVDPVQAGTDGVELTDYDLIGSRRDRSGLFALEQTEQFDVLYLPPPGKGRDAGPAAVLAADMYSRERGAVLIVDPLSEWKTVADAAAGVRELGYASPNMRGYFPRVTERSSEDSVPRPAGGAIAGLLCRQDRTHGPWLKLDQEARGLHRRLRPVVELDARDGRLLNRAGLNAVMRGSAGRTRLSGSVTMGRGTGTHRSFAKLPVRRFSLQLINTIAHGTRWAVFERGDAALAERIRGQILTYLNGLNDLGAFASDGFFVRCDAGVSKRSVGGEHGVTILLVFHPVGCDEPISLTLHQDASGFRATSAAFAPTLFGSTEPDGERY